MTYEEAKKKTRRGRPVKLFESNADLRRESALLEAIEEFSDTNQNELKRIMLGRKVMAGKTFERKIQELLERDVIVLILKGNKKFYAIIDKLHLGDSTKNLNAYISSMDKRI